MKTEIVKIGMEYKTEIQKLVLEFYGIDSKNPIAKMLNGCISELLNYPKYGSVFLIKQSNVIVGYIILSFGYTIEFGGRDAFVDEFYIKEEFRNKGIGGSALDYIVKYAKTTGLKALHLEVKEKHNNAVRLYERKGFKSRSSKIMSLKLN
jgi:ribosomal protein S18 acetylase RimI-like enzyme